jgi:hypothetical protein
MFQLAAEEAHGLRFQSGISKLSRGGRRYLPYAFTQEGVAMLSSVLRRSAGTDSRPAITNLDANVTARKREPVIG